VGKALPGFVGGTSHKWLGEMKVNRYSLTSYIARTGKANKIIEVLPAPHAPFHPLLSPEERSSYKSALKFGNPCYRALWLSGAYRHS